MPFHLKKKRLKNIVMQINKETSSIYNEYDNYNWDIDDFCVMKDNQIYISPLADKNRRMVLVVSKGFLNITIKSEINCPSGSHCRVLYDFRCSRHFPLKKVLDGTYRVHLPLEAVRLSNGELSLEFNIGSTRTRQKVFPTSKPPERVDMEVISYCLQDILECNKNSDFELTSMEGTKFYIHTALLAARSRFYRSRFRDGSAKLFILKDFIRAMVFHMYTGKLMALPAEDIFRVFEMARNLQMKGLEFLCAKRLIELMNRKTVLKIRYYGEMYGVKILLEETDIFRRVEKI